MSKPFPIHDTHICCIYGLGYHKSKKDTICFKNKILVVKVSDRIFPLKLECNTIRK